MAVRSLDISLGFPAVDLPPARSGVPYRGLAALLRTGPRPVDWVGVEVPPSGTVAGEPIERAFRERSACRPDTGDLAVEPQELTPELTSLAESTFFSYVITTCNKPALALRCVRTICASEPGPCEIIVVENRPVGSTVRQTLLSEFSDDERVRVLDEPAPGLSRARNAGLRAAQGEVIAFTDDDIVVDAHWCRLLRRAFACHPEVACVAGPILPLELETAAQLLMERFSPIGTAFARRVYAMDAPPVDQPLFPYTAGFFGSGGNAAFRWDALAGLKGFDPVLGTGTWARGGEDLDIFIRLILAGGRLLYEPCAIAWHPHPDTMERLSHEVFDYGVGLGAMLTKQLVAGPGRSQMIRKIPRGLEYLFSPASHKNASKASGYPERLDRLERTGLALGPAAYLSSRWRARRLRPTDD